MSVVQFKYERLEEIFWYCYVKNIYIYIFGLVWYILTNQLQQGKGRIVSKTNESKQGKWVVYYNHITSTHNCHLQYKTNFFVCTKCEYFTTSHLMLLLCWLAVLLNNTSIHSSSVNSNAILWLFLTEIKNK
jgi:hypothetical protein